VTPILTTSLRLARGHKVSRTLISGMHVKTLIYEGKGCELHPLIQKKTKPIAPLVMAIWDYDAQWAELKQEKGESTEKLSGWISELEDKLQDCGLVPPALGIKLKLIM
jgi:hypothetical protein